MRWTQLLALFLGGKICDAERLYKSSSVTQSQVTNRVYTHCHCRCLIGHLRRTLGHDVLEILVLSNVGCSYTYRPKICDCYIINLNSISVM